MVDITIDGEWQATIDQYSPGILRQQILMLNMPTYQLSNSVVIDTHIVHGYVRGDKNTQSSDKIIDIDRLDIS